MHVDKIVIIVLILAVARLAMTQKSRSRDIHHIYEPIDAVTWYILLLNEIARCGEE